MAKSARPASKLVELHNDSVFKSRIRIGCGFFISAASRIRLVGRRSRFFQSVRIGRNDVVGKYLSDSLCAFLIRSGAVDSGHIT